jgi:hypothetical protein
MLAGVVEIQTTAAARVQAVLVAEVVVLQQE